MYYSPYLLENKLYPKASPLNKDLFKIVASFLAHKFVFEKTCLQSGCAM